MTPIDLPLKIHNKEFFLIGERGDFFDGFIVEKDLHKDFFAIVEHSPGQNIRSKVWKDGEMLGYIDDKYEFIPYKEHIKTKNTTPYEFHHDHKLTHYEEKFEKIYNLPVSRYRKFFEYCVRQWKAEVGFTIDNFRMRRKERDEK